MIYQPSTSAENCRKSEVGAADSSTDGHLLVKNSLIYREFEAEREEIMKHKWLESEKAGRDIGFETALMDWILRHRTNWRKARQKEIHAIC
jgi:hypothetical protein